MPLPSENITQRIFILLIFFLSYLTINVSFGQEKLPDDVKCYLVVGAFNLERNAVMLKTYFDKKNYAASYRKNNYRNLYYVYLFESKDRQEIKNRLLKFRDEFPNFKDSWLYAGNFNGPHYPFEDTTIALSQNTNKEGSSESEVSSGNSIAITNSKITDSNSEEEIQNDVKTVTSEEKIVENTEVKLDKSATIIAKEVKEKIVAPPLEENTYRIYINPFDATSLKEIDGNFLIINTERNKVIREVGAHEALIIDKPNNATNKITVKSDIFDFREVEHTIDLDEPLLNGENIVEIVGDTILLNFNLMRFNKGDVMTMWKVYFYIDAAIMKEESIGQLLQLLRMMQSNPNMKIKIHGHTNGNSHGKVLHLSEGDKNFFSMKGDSHEEINASAKKLSEFRAITIRNWLTDQGISEDRMESIGWGGKKMIFDKHDTQAHKNVRVEIEIVEE